jgi:diguanylate cyclase (GGDEF)-like protein
VDDRPRKQLDEIIDGKQIRTVFQPVVSLRDGTVMGHEALSRMTCKTQFQNPEQLFQFATESDRLWDLEQLCRTTALRTAFLGPDRNPKKRLFLNVNPNVMHDEKFRRGFTKEYLKQYGIQPKNIIFEITERNTVADMDSFRGTVSHYKGQNYNIAIDDVGAGFSGLNLISDIHPHYIKLDMNLIRGIDSDGIKYALVKGMVEISKTANIALIAEGVETREELVTLVDLGVQYAQGYFLLKPDARIRDISPQTRALIVELNRRKNHVFSSQAGGVYISNICTPTETIPPDMRVEDAFEKLKKDPGSFGFCVVDDGRVLGIVTKNSLVLQLSGRYGFSLNQNKPISFLMDANFMSVDFHTPINDVSNSAMTRPPDKLYDFIVVTKNEKYLGTVTIKDLLQKTTEIEVVNAKFENPLTGLPGNVRIEQKISQCISSGGAYSVIYFDIDNFKAYNDVYGFENGDRIIKLLAKALTDHLPEGQFVGHVGGDDFVAVITAGDPAKYCADVMDDFKRNALKYYSPQDIARGYIVAENRHGTVEQFPLVSLSAAGVRDGQGRFSSLVELTEQLARLKKKSKQHRGCCCIWQDDPAERESGPA